MKTGNNYKSDLNYSEWCCRNLCRGHYNYYEHLQIMIVSLCQAVLIG